MNNNSNKKLFNFKSVWGWLGYHFALIAVCVGWGRFRGLGLLNALINSLPVIAVGSIPSVVVASRKLFDWFSSLDFTRKQSVSNSSANTRETGVTPDTRPQALTTSHPILKTIGRLGLLVAGICLAAVAIFGVGSFIIGLFSMRGCTIYRPGPTETEVQKAVNDIRKKTSHLTLRESHVIFEGAKPPEAQYEISISEDYIYLFNLYEYWKEGGNDESQIPTSQLCEKIAELELNADNKEKKILEQLVPGLEAKISLEIKKGIGGELSITDLKKVIVEILYAIQRFAMINSSRTQVLIRGYADGYEKPYQKPVSETYAYNKIEIYPPIDWNSISDACFYQNPNPPPKYKNEKVALSLPYSNGIHQYRNCDLPDLRAKFVKEVFIDPYVEGCKEKYQIETRILKGHEFSKNVKDHMKRKVQVYVLLYRS